MFSLITTVGFPTSGGKICKKNMINNGVGAWQGLIQEETASIDRGTMRTAEDNPGFAEYIVAENRIPTLLSSSISRNERNPWTPEDEGDHYPCGYELWWIYAVLKLEEGRYWDVAMCFEYWMNKTKEGYEGGLSFYRIQHFDRLTKKCYDNLHPDNFPGPLRLSKNELNLTYYNNTMRGLYPDYHFHGEDDVNNITFDIECHATSIPHWVLSEGTNGILPWGFSGTFKYGIIPSLDVKGTITINGRLYTNVTGVGYFEHEFGYIDLINGFKPPSLQVFVDTLRLYFSSAKWWLNEITKNKIEPYFFYNVSNDNLFGWDWIWAIFDNGWSMTYFKATIFGVVEGLTIGLIHFTQDGEKYWEIGSIYTEYRRVLYDEIADIYIPLEMKMVAYEGDMKLHLLFKATTDMTKGYAEDKLCCYVYAGEVEGYFYDGENNVTLKGFCSINPARYMTRSRHTSLDINLALPPHGLGISTRIVSHGLEIEIFYKIQLIPTIEFIFYVKPAP
jgi:hypothetical protein